MAKTTEFDNTTEQIAQEAFAKTMSEQSNESTVMSLARAAARQALVNYGISLARETSIDPAKIDSLIPQNNPEVTE